MGWTLIVAGCIVLLYVVYLLWFTGLETQQEQQGLADRFAEVTTTLPAAEPDAEPEPDAELEIGDAFAALWFERDGDPVVHDEVLFVVEGTSLADLKRGPGHYPASAQVGAEGNLGIAGHRTTYGEPFGRLDELAPGDTIHVVDRAGVEWVYAYREQRVVSPTDVWVVDDPDPIDLGAPTITLTTCHPRFSAAQRLIAWGELVGPADGVDAQPIEPPASAAA
ncbi:MAG: class E sortase [Nitriliruptor sp.]|uniref:class E sortase n=1 Tax=Nitriliruptor sp. TaxID=2448056 RepID=UPI0034A01730